MSEEDNKRKATALGLWRGVKGTLPYPNNGEEKVGVDIPVGNWEKITPHEEKILDRSYPELTGFEEYTKKRDMKEAEILGLSRMIPSLASHINIPADRQRHLDEHHPDVTGIQQINEYNQQSANHLKILKNKRNFWILASVAVVAAAGWWDFYSHKNSTDNVSNAFMRAKRPTTGMFDRFKDSNKKIGSFNIKKPTQEPIKQITPEQQKAIDQKDAYFENAARPIFGVIYKFNKNLLAKTGQHETTINIDKTKTPVTISFEKTVDDKLNAALKKALSASDNIDAIKVKVNPKVDKFSDEKLGTKTPDGQAEYIVGFINNKMFIFRLESGSKLASKNLNDEKRFADDYKNIWGLVKKYALRIADEKNKKLLQEKSEDPAAEKKPASVEIPSPIKTPEPQRHKINVENSKTGQPATNQDTVKTAVSGDKPERTNQTAMRLARKRTSFVLSKG